MKISIFIFVLFLSFSSSAQHYTSKWYNTDNGLPQNSIKDITIDKYGFVWVSTENGIVRYDGNSFLIQDTSYMDNVHFGDFLGSASNDSILAFNDEEKTAVLIHKRKCINYTPPFYKRDLWEVNHRTYKNILRNIPSKLIISKIDFYTLGTHYGDYYFGDRSITFKSKNGAGEKNMNIPFHQKDLQHIFSHDDHIFIGDHLRRRTLVLDKDKYYYINKASLYNDPKTKIFWNKTTGQTFIVNDGGIYLSQYIKGKLKLKFLVRYPAIDKNNYCSMYYDHSYKKLYLGTVSKGLNIISLANFQVSLKNRPFEDEIFYAALAYKNNSVITADGTEYYNNKNRKVYRESVSEKRSLFFDNSENLVYTKENSIQRRLKKYNYQQKDSIFFKNKGIAGIFKTEGLYMASVSDAFKNYLYIFHEDHFQIVKSIIPVKNKIKAVLKADKDRLYLGTDDGLYEASLSKNKIERKIIDHVQIKHIIKTKDGNLWFTTENSGFYLLENNSIPLKMPNDKNNYLSQAHYFLEDSKSNLWISSNNGLFRVKKNKLLDYAENKNTEVLYDRYTKDDGFLNNEFNGSCNPAANQLRNGYFVFPSMEGLVFFDPKDVKSYFPRANQMFIERAEIDGNNIFFKRSLSLKSDYKRVDIFIDIPYYNEDIDNLHLEAKLDNTNDDSWQSIGNNRIFSLGKIPAGSYNLTFRFQTSEDGRFAYKTIPIEISPSFYETILFKIFLGILGISLILLIVKYRTKNLNKKLEQTNKYLKQKDDQLTDESYFQQKLMTAISHDIASPIKFIVYLSKKMLQTDDMNEKKECFESIHNSSEQLYKFTLELTEYIQLFKEESYKSYEHTDIYSVIRSKKLLFKELAIRNNTVIINSCTKNITTNVNKNILAVIVHNIIDNAVKNTSHGTITIKNFEDKSHVGIQIADTGNGMSDEQMRYYPELLKNNDEDTILISRNSSLGLHLVIQLLKKIDGEIIFHRNIPNGTVVEILIKKI